MATKIAIEFQKNEEVINKILEMTKRNNADIIGGDLNGNKNTLIFYIKDNIDALYQKFNLAELPSVKILDITN